MESSALTAVAPVLFILPFSALALLLVWLPLRLIIDIAFWWFALGYLVAGLALFWRPLQLLILPPLLGARPPNNTEEGIIRPLWTAIALANNLPRDRYVLRVLPSEDLNAFACGGHLVVVTSFAVHELSRRELAGVLAHELSHHLGLHTVALTIGHWLSIPVVLLARVGVFLQNVATAANQSFAQGSVVLRNLGTFVAALLHVVSWLFVVGLTTSDALANTVGRTSEYQADRRAVRMGYGGELASALRRVISLGGGGRPVSWRARLETSHPPARTRVARIEAMMRHPSG
ncbi:MAG: M48 family metalloprotease [Acidimicrobiia bacterium]|nr:M48 family metalloprotease [Acidimicrobiia bacterium]